MASLTTQQRARNSNLANVLNSVGVRCTPCTEAHIRNLPTAKAREDYLRLLKLSPDSIAEVQAIFEVQG